MSRKAKKEMLESLRERFLDGDKLTIKEMVEDYFSPNSPYAYLVAAKEVRGLIGGVKRWFRKEHALWFGNIDDEGRYGLFTDESEVRYGMVRYYRFVKGVLFNANILAKNARDKGMLPAGVTTERMLVAKLEEEKEEKNDHR
jgi:hypothetical protein